MTMQRFFLIVAAVCAGCGDSEPPSRSTVGGGEDDSGRPAVALPDDLPADIPVYPGAKPVYVGSSEGGIRQSPATSIQFETTDSVESVQDFYVRELEEHSWTIAHQSSNALTADKGERNLNVTFVELPGRDGTVGLSFNYNRPDTADKQP